MGSIVDRSGILYLDFRYRGIRCRESSRLPATPQNRRRAETTLKRIEAEIVLGTFDYSTYFPNSAKVSQLRTLERRQMAGLGHVPDFGLFAEDWFDEKKVEWRQSYQDTIRVSLDKHLIPHFGNKSLDQIDKGAILRFRAELAELPGQSGGTMSPSRVNHIMTPLRMILTEGADRFGFKNPWQNIKPLKEPRTQVDPFSIQEVQLLLEKVRPDFKAYYTTRFFTGLRTSEIDGLQWKYVDFERRQLLVREALVQGRMVGTKTDGSSREVAMNSLVYDALVGHRKLVGDRSPYVFSNRNGSHLLERNVTRRVWYPILRHLGIPLRRPYQTRHTAATLWLAAGESPEWIARQMGHTTTEMLFRVYSRFVPNLTRQDGSAFERLLAAEFTADPATHRKHDEEGTEND